MNTSTRLLFALLLLLTSGVVMAAAPVDCAAPVDRGTGLPGVAPGLEMPTQPPAADLAPVEGPEVSAKACSATAQCGDGSTVSCLNGGSGTCQGVDANCPNQRGYVRCGSITRSCPLCTGDYYCTQGAACGLALGNLCGYQGTHPGVCYQGSCRCWCTEGTSCSSNSDCGPPNTGGVCAGGTCYCQ